MFEGCHIRIARPTDQLQKVSEFYELVLGFNRLSEFKNHEGFDGIMLGHSDAPYHLEFTSHPDHQAGRSPSAEHLLVFYTGTDTRYREILGHLESRGVKSVKSHNPFWDRGGTTIEDPDGYRIVVFCGQWTA
ncbi:MAG: VOC family protein [Planctomycetota bacterium]